jgi:hypothetical protein
MAVIIILAPETATARIPIPASDAMVATSSEV